MGNINLIINFLTLLLVFYFVFLKKYLEKKGENLATKEDIAGITEKMEEVKTKYAGESHMLVKKREAYEEIARYLQVFIIGREEYYEEYKKGMTDAYSAAWLWSGDDLIKALNKHIEMQKSLAEGKSVEQKELKESYASCMLLIRKDAGYEETKLKENDFIFFNFS